MDFKKKRWVCLIAGLIIEACCGVVYAWSVFQGPLVEKFNWAIDQVAIAYTINLVTTMIVTLLFGTKVKQKLSLKNEVLLGGVMYALGILGLIGLSGGIWQLYLLFGVLNGAGAAFIYPVLISYALELFPERTGFAGGLMTAGYGLGAVLWAPLATRLYTQSGDITQAFLVLGILFLVVMVVLSRLLRPVPQGFRDQLLAGARQSDQRVFSVYDVDRPRMLRLPAFWFILIVLMLGLACGGMIINQGSPIVQLQFGMTASAAALIVSLLAISNVLGRLIWGTVSDRLGKSNTLVVLTVILFCCLLGLLCLDAKGPFLGVLLGTVLCYGGFASQVAPVTAELFGGRNVGQNYSVTFCVFGLSSLIGPPLIASIRQSTGQYTTAFVCALVLALVGIVCALWLSRKVRAARKSQLDAE